jgi:hypothetical protein
MGPTSRSSRAEEVGLARDARVMPDRSTPFQPHMVAGKQRALVHPSLDVAARAVLAVALLRFGPPSTAYN